MGSHRSNGTIFEGYVMGNDFKQYLDRTGALETIGNALECLRNEPELPENPQEYIQKQLAMRCGAAADPLLELKAAKAKISMLQKVNHEIRERVARKFALAAEARKPKSNGSSRKAAKTGTITNVPRK